MVLLVYHEAFKYLGIKLTLTGTSAEKKIHMLTTTREEVHLFERHPYSHAQVHWLINTSVVSLFWY